MGAKSPTVERVVGAQLCTGCGLCAAVSRGAIAMETVAPGYARPIQKLPVSAAAEQAIASACPGAVVAGWHEAPNRHPVWGPWHRVVTGYATDPEVRFRASSGGGITALALHALETGLVDRVVHVRADPERPTRNIVVTSNTTRDVVAGAGSRYASSSPLVDIDRMLADGGAVAFIGKPCDVSALRRLALTDPRVGRHVPLTLSFFCAGVPSEDGADNVLAAMRVAKPDVSEFRYRGNGWPGVATATLRDGRVAEMSYAESWGVHLSKELQFRCKICPDAVGGVADIACADAWYGDEKGYPSFGEQDGRSLVMTRTKAGEDHLANAVAAGALAIEPLDIAEIDAMQPSQARRKRLIRSRLAALAATLQPRPMMGSTSIGDAAARATRLEEARSFLGTARRIVMGQR